MNVSSYISRLLNLTLIGFVAALVSAFIFAPRSYAQTDPPSMNPGTGIYGIGQSITLTAPSPFAQIYYTTDGTEPTTSSTSYLFPVQIKDRTQLNAIAVVSGVSSSVTEAFYELDGNASNVTKTDILLWLRSEWPVVTSGTPPLLSNWIDLTTNANNAEQSTTANKPTMAGELIAGLPILRFKSSISEGKFLSLPSFSGLNTGFSVFIVLRPSPSGAPGRLVDFGTGSTMNSIYLEQAATGDLALHVFNSTADSAVTATGALLQNRFQVVEAIYDGTSTATLFKNGEQLAQSTSMQTAQNVSRSSNFIGQSSGGGGYFDGDIAEIIAYARGLSAFERRTIESYLMLRYGLKSAPSAPQFSINGGTLPIPTEVALAAEPDAVVHFTIDGSTPAGSSPVYSGPIRVSYSQTIKAIAFRQGLASAMSSESYTLDPANWPEPSPSDMTAPTINLQLPTPTQ